MSKPRRSTRQRKQIHSFYEDAQKEVKEANQRISPKNKRRRRSRAQTGDKDGSDENSFRHEEEAPASEDNDDDGADSITAEEQQLEEEEESQKDDDEEMEEEEDIVEIEEPEDEEEEEECTPKPKAKRQNQTSALQAASSPKRPSPVQTPKTTPTVGVIAKRKAPTVSTKTARGVSRKGIQSALLAIAKKFLHPLESPDYKNIGSGQHDSEEEKRDDNDEQAEDKVQKSFSLIAALLHSCKNNPEAGSLDASLKKQLQGKETPYTLNLVHICRQIYEDYENDPNAAQVACLNLVFRSAGATYESLLDPSEVDLVNVDDDELKNLIRAVVGSLEETPQEQVLFTADTPLKLSVAFREFQLIFREFWYLLTTTALSESLSGNSKGDKEKDEKKKRGSSYDSDDDDEEDVRASQAPHGFRFQIEMARQVVYRMIEMSQLTSDDIRAGVCVAIYQMSVAVLERTVGLREKLALAERQLKVAKKSKMKRKAEALESQTKTWNHMIMELEEIVSRTVNGVFFYRYKDVHPQIRAESLQAMAQFVVIRPDLYFSNSYLKYFGWLLSDKSPVVREKAACALLEPFRVNQERSEARSGRRVGGATLIDTSKMTFLAEKFALRLADCTMDVDVTVQERVMELLLAFSRNNILDQIENDTFWKTINMRALANDTSAIVRRDALMFVLEQLEAFDSRDAAQTEAEAVERINQLSAWVSHVLGAVNDIPLEKIPYENVSFVVKSLRLSPVHNTLVDNFSAMLRALKECQETQGKSAEAKQRATVIQRRVLLEMLVASVEQEMSGLDSMDGVVDPVLMAAQRAAEDQTKESKANKKKKAEGLQEKLTIAMLETLPDLFETYRTEIDILRLLTTLPKYFHPSVLSSSSQKKHFIALLGRLSSLFASASDHNVLFNCCLTMTLLAKGDHTRSSEALVVLKRVVSSVCDELTGLLENKSELVENYEELAGIEVSINLCLHRLMLLSLRWPLHTLLNGGTKELEKMANMVIETEIRDLRDRIVATDGGDEEVEVVPEIWDVAPKPLHIEVAKSIIHALSFLRNTTAWALQEQLQLRKEEQDPSFVIRMRDHIWSLCILVYELYIKDKEGYKKHHREFAQTVQLNGQQIVGDLRSMFPKEWASHPDPFLQACALVEDGPMAGGSRRFIESLGDKLKAAAPGDHKEVAVRGVLFPAARALCSHWKVANRREAGSLLLHIVGYGKEAGDIVSSLSRLVKKEDPVRLLEAHMAGLRQAFEEWIETEPVEPKPDHTSEEEVEQFKIDEKAHKAKFELLEQQAKRLSSSLGVVKLYDKNLKPKNITGFLKEGIRYAFSTTNPSGEVLFLGAHLLFLRLLLKYLNWVRKDNDQVGILRTYFNSLETELRNHPDFPEIYEDDLKAMATFRQAGNLGAFLIEDEDDGSAGAAVSAALSTASSRVAGSKRRLSQATSISSIGSDRSKGSSQNTLSPLPEEEADEGVSPAVAADKGRVQEDEVMSCASSISSKDANVPSPSKTNESTSPAFAGANEGGQEDDETSHASSFSSTNASKPSPSRTNESESSAAKRRRLR